MSENKTNNNPAIQWVDGNIPKSSQFDDTYYSKADGYLETQFVFLDGNDLPNRWKQMQRCTIAELGFGTGLNFLTALEQWQANAREGATLHFISFEQYPMTKEAMQTALSRWPKLEPSASRLCELWHEAIIEGAEKISIQWSDEVTLTVWCSDANLRLPQENFEADAWFLDGFSPAKNPELWSKELMRLVWQRTTNGGTFATYTSAGWVRRNLAAAGFEVQRVQGHAGKRQMSIGKKL